MSGGAVQFDFVGYGSNGWTSADDRNVKIQKFCIEVSFCTNCQLMHMQPHVRSTHQTVQTGNIRRPYQGGIVLAGQDDQQTGRSSPINHHVEQSAVRAALVELAGRQSIEQVPDEGGDVQPKGQEPPAGLEDHEEEADEGEDDPSVADEVWHVQEDISCCCWHVGWLVAKRDVQLGVL